jgi:hypothetical protein
MWQTLAFYVAKLPCSETRGEPTPQREREREKEGRENKKGRKDERKKERKKHPVLTSNPKQFCMSFSVSILFLMAKASFLDSFLLFLSVSITSSSARSERNRLH